VLQATALKPVGGPATILHGLPEEEFDRGAQVFQINFQGLKVVNPWNVAM
jgi:hypothetical protein